MDSPYNSRKEEKVAGWVHSYWKISKFKEGIKLISVSSQNKTFAIIFKDNNLHFVDNVHQKYLEITTKIKMLLVHFHWWYHNILIMYRFFDKIITFLIAMYVKNILSRSLSFWEMNCFKSFTISYVAHFITGFFPREIYQSRQSSRQNDINVKQWSNRNRIHHVSLSLV